MNKKTKKLLFWENKETLKILEKELRIDSLSITSTDTTFGFLANTTKKSFDSLNTIKGNRSNKPYLLLIGSIDSLQYFIDTKSLSAELYRLISLSWPGPVTFILKAKKEIPSFLTSDRGTIAVRCPNHHGLLKLLQSFDGLFSTSANQSGKPVPTTIEEIDEIVQNSIDYIVIDELNSMYESIPSTLLDCSHYDKDGQEEIHVIRSGAYPITTLEKFYGNSFKK